MKSTTHRSSDRRSVGALIGALLVTVALLSNASGAFAAPQRSLDKAQAVCASQSGTLAPSDIPDSYVCTTTTSFTSKQLAAANNLCNGYYHGQFDGLAALYECFYPPKLLGPFPG